MLKMEVSPWMFDWVLNTPLLFDTAQKMKFSIKDFFSKYDQTAGGNIPVSLYK